MRTLFLLLATIAMLSFISCKKDSEDPDYCSKDWATEEADALFDAWTVYQADMSIANCNAYKAAYLDYIEALELFLQCDETWSAEDRQEVQEAIDDAEESMNELTCE